MDESTTTIMTPVIQYGFAGLCVILLGVVVWMVKNFIRVLEESNRVIATNTQAIQAVDKNSADTLEVAIELKNELLKRPCIAQFKQV